MGTPHCSRHRRNTRSGVRKHVPELTSVVPPTPRPNGSTTGGSPNATVAPESRYNVRNLSNVDVRRNSSAVCRRPSSTTTTSIPASARTFATTAPPAPEPTTTTSAEPPRHSADGTQVNGGSGRPGVASPVVSAAAASNIGTLTSSGTNRAAARIPSRADNGNPEVSRANRDAQSSTVATRCIASLSGGLPARSSTAATLVLRRWRPSATVHGSVRCLAWPPPWMPSQSAVGVPLLNHDCPPRRGRFRSVPRFGALARSRFCFPPGLSGRPLVHCSGRPPVRHPDRGTPVPVFRPLIG